MAFPASSSCRGLVALPERVARRGKFRPTKALQGTCRDAPRAPARQQGPGKRSLPGRLTKAPRGPVGDKLPGPARQQPRQGACRDKLPPCTRAPAHPPMCRPGAFPGTRGERLCIQRCEVASGADKITIVANGGAPDGPFLYCLGDTDGHLMPLSPAVRVRYDNTVAGSCAYYST